MGGDRAAFVDALAERHDDVAHRAAERIVGELPSYRALGHDAVPVIAAVVGGFYEDMIERWREDDPGSDQTRRPDVAPPGGIDLGIPLTDRLSAQRIASEVVWEVVHDVATTIPGLDTDFLLWATSVAFKRLNALSARVTEQHLEIEHQRRRWRQELERTLVQATLRNPPDLDLATTTARALGVDLDQQWQVSVVLRATPDAEPLAEVGSLRSALLRPERTVLAAPSGRETKILVGGTPVEADELDVAGDTAAGIGRPGTTLDRLAASYGRTHDAAVVCERRGGGVLSVDVTHFERFLAGRVSPRELADDLLEPLRALPAERAEMLAESLEAYLDAECSVTAAARRLHLHPQSFRYRLGKLQEVFGRDLEDPSRRLLLHVAITRYRQTWELDLGGSPRAVTDGSA